MRAEMPAVTYEGTMLDNEIQTLEPLNTEAFGRFAGKIATILVLAPHAAYVMPEGEIMTLEAAIAAVDTAEAVKFKEDAANN
jgi:hypothetical protein